MKAQSSKRKAQSLKLKILQNRQVAAHVYKIALEAPVMAKNAKPGQFIMAHLDGYRGVFLRRPFSIHRAKQRVGVIEILYEIVGKGTEILAGKKSGAVLDVIGPLGNGFSYQLPVTSYPLDFARDRQLPVLVAGGIGVAPLLFLAQKIVNSRPLDSARGRQSTVHRKKIKVLIGAKTKKHILCEKEFRRLGCDVRVATDDGSKGFKGFVTELLKDFLRKPKTANRKPILYACGPKPMLKAAAEFSRHNGIPAQVSLEEHMACGIGACLGCVVDTSQGYKRVCREGPVFNADEIAWEDKG